MSIYELMNQVIYCNNIEDGMRRLIELTTILEKERYTSKLLDCFYERIREPFLMLCNFGFDLTKKESQYCIESRTVALSLYVVLTIPKRKKPQQTLKELQNYAYEKLALCKTGRDNQVTKKVIEDILQYMDEKYQYSEKVFRSSKRKVAFLLLDIEHINHTSECVAFKSEEELYFAFFFYMFNKEEQEKRNAVMEVFLMLSMALIIKYTKDCNKIPEEILQLHKDTCLPKFEELDIHTQDNNLAELLSSGLMYKSPFQEYDTNDYIDEDIKILCNLVASRMLETLG